MRSLCRVLDVSNQGLKITSHERLPPGTLLYLEFPATFDERPLTLMGEVVWVRAGEGVSAPHEVGILFKEAPRDAGTIISGMEIHALTA